MTTEQLAKLYEEVNGEREAFFKAVCAAGGSKLDASYYMWQQNQKQAQ